MYLWKQCLFYNLLFLIPGTVYFPLTFEPQIQSLESLHCCLTCCFVVYENHACFTTLVFDPRNSVIFPLTFEPQIQSLESLLCCLTCYFVVLMKTLPFLQPFVFYPRYSVISPLTFQPQISKAWKVCILLCELLSSCTDENHTCFTTLVFDPRRSAILFLNF